MSTTVSPVTVTALAAVNTASPKGAAPAAVLLMVSMSSTVPTAMTPRKASSSGRVGRTRLLIVGRRRGHIMQIPG